MGAILIFVTSFMIVSGVQIILGSGMDARKTFAIGIALIFGFSLDIVPGLYAVVPGWLRPLFESSLTLAIMIAVVLNQLLRGGGAPAAGTPTATPTRPAPHPTLSPFGAREEAPLSLEGRG